MKKIAFHVSSLAKGGAERVIVNIASFFASLDGYEVVLATHHVAEIEYPIPKGVRRINVDICGDEISKSRVRNFFRRNSKMRTVWKQEKVDLVFSVFAKTNFRTVLTTLGIPTKAIVSVVSDSKAEYPTMLSRLCAQILFALCDGIVFQTEEEQKFFWSAVKKKSVILPNSVNPDFMRERYGGERSLEIVMVGRLDNNKNPQLLVKAFAHIAEEYPEWFVSIYGDGEIRENIEQLIKQLNMQRRVFLRGIQSEIADKIQGTSIFVLASDVEGMPNVLLEAMSLGLAVISTDAAGGGPAHMIQNGENGILIPVNDENALIVALRKLMSNEALREELGQAAHKIQEQVNPQCVNGLWQDYFESVLEG